MVYRRWYFAVWLPFAVAACFAVVWLFIFTDDGLPMPPGPGGGGELIIGMLVWVLRLIALVGVVVSMVLRPRGEARNFRSVAISAVLWIAITVGTGFILPLVTGVTVHVSALNTQGQPMPSVQMEYNWAKRNLFLWFRSGKGTVTTDINGIATFHIPDFHSLYVYGDRKLHPTHELHVSTNGPHHTWQVLYSKDGSSNRNTPRENLPRASTLDMTIEFDPLPSKPKIP
jgi:hypothetical protein